jgi:N-acetyl-alpha-D-glucosaminyl L-malate synthase BshA
LKYDTVKFFNIKRPIEVIPNFIDLSGYDGITDCERIRLAPNGERIVTHVSNFRSPKRIPDVIKIFKGISDNLPARLVLVGDGPEVEQAQQQVKDLGLQEKVAFLGKTTEVERILCMSDLFLLPSVTESFGLAALEAMAAKVPVISSNAGGIPEVNVQGVTGYLSDVGNVTEMVKNAVHILSSDELLAEFKANAYQHAQTFAIDKIVPKYEKIYHALMEAK